MALPAQHYKASRNAILNKYREDPKRRLSFEDVRGSLDGDPEGLRSIYNFLDRWGIINYEAGGSGANSDASPFSLAPAGEAHSISTLFAVHIFALWQLLEHVAAIGAQGRYERTIERQK